MLYTTRSFLETKSLGEKLALRLRSGQAKEIKNRKSAIVLALHGNLGGGKTTFLQGFAKGLGIKEKILSPTFVILKHFKIPEHKIQNTKYTNFYHIDCYRLKDSKDILELDFKKIILNSENIIAVEWPEKIKEVLPENIIFIDFKFIDEQTREIKVKM